MRGRGEKRANHVHQSRCSRQGGCCRRKRRGFHHPGRPSGTGEGRRDGRLDDQKSRRGESREERRREEQGGRTDGPEGFVSTAIEDEVTVSLEDEGEDSVGGGEEALLVDVGIGGNVGAPVLKKMSEARDENEEGGGKERTLGGGTGGGGGTPQPWLLPCLEPQSTVG